MLLSNVIISDIVSHCVLHLINDHGNVMYSTSECRYYPVPGARDSLSYSSERDST